MNIEKLWEKAVAFHGHQCPGLAIGVKACQAAMELLELERAQDEELVCITENDACGVDAIQALLGCSLGKGNLIYYGTGKQAFTFYRRRDGKGVRLYLKAENPGLEREDWMHHLLHMAPEEAFTVGEPQLPLPQRARRFASVTCQICGEKAAEHTMHLQEGKWVCSHCFAPYKRGW